MALKMHLFDFDTLIAHNDAAQPALHTLLPRCSVSHSVIAPKLSVLPFPASNSSEVNQTDIRSIAMQILEADPIFRGRLALRAIEVEADGDKLVLRGRLPSYYLKQRLQELVLRVAGVQGVENLVEVTTC